MELLEEDARSQEAAHTEELREELEGLSERDLEARAHDAGAPESEIYGAQSKEALIELIIGVTDHPIFCCGIKCSSARSHEHCPFPWFFCCAPWKGKHFIHKNVRWVLQYVVVQILLTITTVVLQLNHVYYADQPKLNGGWI